MAPQKIRSLPLDPEAYRLGGILGAICVVSFCLAWPLIWVPALLATVAVLAFFRDPARRVPAVPGAVVSPADGKVTAVRTNNDPKAGPVGGPCISIFLSVLDVHMNRAPYEGVVTGTEHHAGAYLNAMDPESSTRNECNWIYLDCGTFRMSVCQIAGLIARRIICRVKPGQQLKRGQRIGLIRFGSRTDLYLPPEARVQVEVGQRVTGGQTIVAYLSEQ